MSTRTKTRMKVTPSIRTYSIKSTRDLATLVENAARIDGWSTNRLAGAANLCYQTVDRLIDGTTKFPRLETAIRVLSALDYEITVSGIGERRRVVARDAS